MKSFIYKAKDKNGKNIKGKIESENKTEAEKKINEQFPYVLMVKEKKKKNDLNLNFNLFNSKFKLKDLYIFLRQLSAILSVGIPITKALDLLTEVHPKIKEMKKELAEGSNFSETCKNSKIFPNFLVNMVKVGEESGSLDKVLEELSVYYKKEDKRNKETISALIYPTIILVMSFFAINFLMLFVLPAFAQTYIDLDIKLPTITAFVIFVSDFTINNIINILISVIFSFIIFVIVLIQDKTRFVIDFILLKLPLIKDFVVGSNLIKFSNNLNMLYKSGLPIIDSISIANKTIGNKYLKYEIEKSHQQIKEGTNLYDSFKNKNLFPKIALQMLRVGEDTGNLSLMLEKIIELYEEESQEKFEKLTTLIEPVMILFLGIVIGTIAISMILPIFDMVQIFN